MRDRRARIETQENWILRAGERVSNDELITWRAHDINQIGAKISKSYQRSWSD